MKKKILSVLTAVMLVCAAWVPAVRVEAEGSSSVKLYRLYNPHTGEHFYTGNRTERVQLYHAGWRDESIAWNTPAQGTPVYRLYNPNSGDHHYTASAGEKNALKNMGWRDEGAVFRSAEKGSGIPVYREYNPHAVKCNHNYTVSKGEHSQLVKAGWRDEGIAFYADSLNEDIDLLYQPVLDKIVSAARTRIGSSYTLAASGRVGPNSFDCSGLVDWVYATAGVNHDMFDRRCNTDAMNAYLLGQTAHPTTKFTWTYTDLDGDAVYTYRYHTGDIVLRADSPADRTAGKFFHALIVVNGPKTVRENGQLSVTETGTIIDSVPGDIFSKGGVIEHGFWYAGDSWRVFRIIDD